MLVRGIVFHYNPKKSQPQSQPLKKPKLASQRLVLLSERKNEKKADPLAGNLKEFTRAQEWLLNQLESNGLKLEDRTQIIALLHKNISTLAEKDKKIEWLHQWVHDNLKPIPKIFDKWTFFMDRDSAAIFQAHLKKGPRAKSPAACYRVPTSVATFFSRFIATVSAEQYNFKRRKCMDPLDPELKFLILLAKEGKFNYVQFGVKNIDEEILKFALPQLVKNAAQNNHVDIVRFLMKKIDDPSALVPALFKIALTINSVELFTFLVKTYPNALRDPESSRSIETEIRFGNAQHNTPNPIAGEHPLIALYNRLSPGQRRLEA